MGEAKKRRESKKDPCTCSSPCGMTEISRKGAVEMRAFGYVVHNGLDNRLPGYWTKSCSYKAYWAQRVLMNNP